MAACFTRSLENFHLKRLKTLSWECGFESRKFSHFQRRLNHEEWRDRTEKAQLGRTTRHVTGRLRPQPEPNLDRFSRRWRFHEKTREENSSPPTV